MLVRFPDGIEGEHFYQKRAPKSRPSWIEVVELHFPSGRGAERSCLATRRRSPGSRTSLASSCIRIRCAPRISIIPTSCASISIPCPASRGSRFRKSPWCHARVLPGLQSRRLAKTSGSRGIHIVVRIERRWDFDEVRSRCARTRARSREACTDARDQQVVERRTPRRVRRLQPERKDRTVASAYSVRPTPDARVSAPLAWAEVDDCNPADFTLASMPARFKKLGDLHAGIDEHAGSIEGLLELFERQGMGDAPWPPHYRKQESEPPRVNPRSARLRSANHQNR
jgi:hypothetical protein